MKTDCTKIPLGSNVLIAVQRKTKHKFLVVHQGDRVQLRGQIQSYAVGPNKRDCYFHKGNTVDWGDLSGRPTPAVLTLDLARELFNQNIQLQMPEPGPEGTHETTDE